MTLLLLLVSVAFAVFVGRAARHSPRVLGPAAGVVLFAVSMAAFQGGKSPRSPDDSGAPRPIIATKVDPVTTEPVKFKRAEPKFGYPPTTTSVLSKLGEQKRRVAAASSQSSGSDQVAVPSDRKARYYVLSSLKRPDGLREITTKRVGPSGTSYSSRVVDCEAGTFAYSADGDSWEEFEQSRHVPGNLEKLAFGSISYYASLKACGTLSNVSTKSLLQEVQEALDRQDSH